MAIESRAAMVMISAHDTLPGQNSSRAALAASMTLYPLTVKLGGEVRSVVDVSFSIMDASQPCI